MGEENAGEKNAVAAGEAWADSSRPTRFAGSGFFLALVAPQYVAALAGAVEHASEDEQ